MNNQNRQVPLDDYSPREALQELSTSVLIVVLPVTICHLPPICKRGALFYIDLYSKRTMEDSYKKGCE